MISRGIAGARIGRWRHTAILVLITHLATRFCHADSIAVHGIPSVLAPGVEGSMLIATRFASTETQAAAVALDGATGPVVLVRQVSGQHCPPYDPAEVRGAFVLENSTDINACSIGRRVEAAAAAGAIGWLYVASNKLEFDPLPGGLTYALSPGDVARLLDAPLAADVTQDSPALSWLLSAAEAGNRPLVTFSVQSDDGEGAWERMRAGGLLVLWRVLVCLHSLAVVELSIARLVVFTDRFEARARSTFISTRAPTLLRTSEPPGNNGAFGTLSRRSSWASSGPGRTSLPAISEPGERCCKWQIPVATTVLVLDILGCTLRLVSAAVDPYLTTGLMSLQQGETILGISNACNLVASGAVLIYRWSLLSLHSQGLDTLVLDTPLAKFALLVVAIAAFATEVLLLIGWLGSLSQPILIALSRTVLQNIALPFVLAASSIYLRFVRTSHVREKLGPAASHMLHSLMDDSLLLSLLTISGVSLLWGAHRPYPMLACTFVWSVALNAGAYTRAASFQPIGRRTPRGPLRVLYLKMIGTPAALWICFQNRHDEKERRRFRGARIIPNPSTRNCGADSVDKNDSSVKLSLHGAEHLTKFRKPPPAWGSIMQGRKQTPEPDSRFVIRESIRARLTNLQNGSLDDASTGRCASNASSSMSAKILSRFTPRALNLSAPSNTALIDGSRRNLEVYSSDGNRSKDSSTRTGESPEHSFRRWRDEQSYSSKTVVNVSIHSVVDIPSSKPRDALPSLPLSIERNGDKNGGKSPLTPVTRRRRADTSASFSRRASQLTQRAAMAKRNEKIAADEHARAMAAKENKKAEVEDPLILTSVGAQIQTHLTMGVSLTFLRDFVDAASIDAERPTAEVVALVQVLTARSGKSLAELYVNARASDGHLAVSEATVFVTHAQACSLAKLIDALDGYLYTNTLPADKPEYFWIDLMSIRQGNVSSDVQHIGDVIQHIGKVAMVLDPWNKPMCLTRVWCLFEIAQTNAGSDKKPQEKRRRGVGFPSGSFGSAFANTSRAPPTKFKSMPTSPALLSSAGFEISAESLRSEPTVLNSFINVGEIVVPSARGTSPQHLAPSSTRSSAANMSRRKKSGNVSAVLLLSRISPAQAVNITLGDEPPQIPQTPMPPILNRSEEIRRHSGSGKGHAPKLTEYRPLRNSYPVSITQSSIVAELAPLSLSNLSTPTTLSAAAVVFPYTKPPWSPYKHAIAPAGKRGLSTIIGDVDSSASVRGSFKFRGDVEQGNVPPAPRLRRSGSGQTGSFRQIPDARPEFLPESPGNLSGISSDISVPDFAVLAAARLRNLKADPSMDSAMLPIVATPSNATLIQISRESRSAGGNGTISENEDVAAEVSQRLRMPSAENFRTDLPISPVPIMKTRMMQILIMISSSSGSGSIMVALVVIYV